MSDLSVIVLCGGSSKRMGEDKSMLTLHKHPLYMHAAQKLGSVCKSVFLSVNKFQALNSNYKFPLIIDRYSEQGPLGGILSSLECLGQSIFVLAVDMPFMTLQEIQNLMALRNPYQHITLYHNVEAGKYEAMFSIWEYSVLHDLKSFFDSGGRSAQTLLKELNIPIIPINDMATFKSVNTLEEWDSLTKYIG